MNISINAHAVAADPVPRSPAFGSLINPSPVPYKNGDFCIGAYDPLAEKKFGDGVDEATFWDFDFRADANYRAFKAHGGPIISAYLILSVVFGIDINSNGDVAIDGLDSHPTTWPDATSFIPMIFTLGLVTQGGYNAETVRLEMLRDVSKNRFYTSARILRALLNKPVGASPCRAPGAAVPPDGVLQMIFSDQALVTSASLTLTRGH